MKKLTYLVVLLGVLMCYGIVNAAVVHQYAFNTNGQAEDSVGTADLTINGTASVAGGVLILPGGGARTNNASATGAALTELGATVNGTDQLTMELWFTQSSNTDWAKLFMAGNGTDQNYMDITPRRGNDGNVGSCSYRFNADEIKVNTPGAPIANNTAYYIACTWDETADEIRIYEAEVGNLASAVTATVSLGGNDLASLIFTEFYLGSAVHFGDGDYNGQIDEFRIHDTALSVSEIEASFAAGPDEGPTPKDGSTLIPTDQQLSWTEPIAYTPDGYDVYIGTDPNVNSGQVLGIVGTTVDPATDLGVTLLNDKTYHWRVDALEPNQVDPQYPIVHTGSVWSFTTIPPVPVVTGDPVSQTVPSGTEIDLSATALNTDTYTWYRSVDAVADVTDTYVGTGSTIQVTIDDVSKEGWYYCVASNTGSPETDTSATARVMTERLVGYWDFEGDLADNVTGGAPTHNGSAIDPNFVAGVPEIGGQGYQFFGDGRIVTIADSNDYFNFYSQGMTISCWVKDQNPSIWDTVVSKEHDREIDWAVGKGFYLGRSDGGSSVFAIRPSEAFGANFPVDDWHQLVGVHDPAANAMRVYVDGVLTTTLENVNPVSWNAPNLAPLVFGAESTDGTVGTSTATIDEVKIYSYARNSTEIAQQYVDVMGGYICVGGNPTADLSGDCQVNLDDLKVLAENWLESNRIE